MSDIVTKTKRKGFQKPGPGRPKGLANKTTVHLKEAILRAAIDVGDISDGKPKGPGGITGYCRFLARHEPKSFAVLMGKVLPMQITGSDGGPIVFQTIYEQGDK